MKLITPILLLSLIIYSCSRTDAVQNQNQTNTDNTISIDFLDAKSSAVAILDESYEPYFSILQIREIYALTGIEPPANSIDEARAFARQKFSSAVTDFSAKEKEAIEYVITIIKKTLEIDNLNLIANHPWKFIKIEDWLCGGYAHTRGDYIILSQRHLNHLTSDWSEQMSKSDSLSVVKKLGALLVHEQFHSLQRQYPEKFSKLYINSWGFEKVKVELDSSILINQLTNPDAPLAEWIVNYDSTFYWVRTLINENATIPQMGKDFIDVVFTLEQKNNKFVVKKEGVNHLVKQNLTDFKRYIDCFPVSQGLDHPNEITAYMFSKYFVSVLNNEEPFKNVSPKSQFFSKEYLNWLHHEF